MKTAVLIADDHLVVRRGLRALLEAEPDVTVVGEVTDGRAVAGAVEELRPDVLILDLVMPGMNGLDVLKQLAAKRLPAHTVVLSMHASEAYAAEAFHHGALCYVVKEASASQLIDAVQHAARGLRFLSDPLSEAGVAEYTRQVKACADDRYETLTAREREVLNLAAHGLTNRAIGEELAISPRTAEAHRANVLRKLGLKGQQELLRYAFRRRILDI